VGAIAICDLIKTTLGPCGLDKILQKIGPNDQSINVTNDGATILNSVHVDNAAAKVLVDIAKVQDAQVGDGTTSVAVLAGELLREAEVLIFQQRIHPQTICDGWSVARKVALQTLEQQAALLSGETITGSTNSSSSSSSRATDSMLTADSTTATSLPCSRDHLMEIARTTLSSKLLTHEKEHFATIAVEAVVRLAGSNNLHHIQIVKIAGGSLRDSYLEEGFLLAKTPGVGQPTRIDGGARILLANTSMDTDKIKIYGSRVKVDSIDKVAEIEQAEKKKMQTKVEKILQHYINKKSGEADEKHLVNCFINRQLIYNYPEALFTAAGIMAIEHADFDGMDRLAAVLGGDVTSTFDTPNQVTLGECQVIEPILIGEETLLRFGGCKTGHACSIVIRGASRHVLDEAERSLHDALAILTTVVRDPRTVYGGGWAELAMATAVDAAATRTPGKQALAMTAFARALRQLPMIVAENGGYDAPELIAQLQAAHAQSQSTSTTGDGSAAKVTAAGLDMTNGTVGDMQALGIRESYQSKKSVVVSASEAAEMILRVDDIIKAAPRRRDEMGY
jgi:T-complex protein 1 subunit beta